MCTFKEKKKISKKISLNFYYSHIQSPFFLYSFYNIIFYSLYLFNFLGTGNKLFKLVTNSEFCNKHSSIS